MNYTNNFKKFTILVLVLFQLAAASSAQTGKFPEPRQEKLLNNLKLLVWNEPKAEKVTVKLRIHSGSAFDPLGKEGVMALLGDALFPNESQREFFTEDLGGSLEVTSNFDYLQINATGNSDQFLTILETLATAVTNPQINKENTAKIVSARLEKLKELEKNPAYIVDQAVAKRLFGDFPYGRAQAGTSASLTKIDFADLIFARQRFLTADNATLAVSGNVKHDLVFRAVRRYFGAWEKADKKVPATFRQPEAPETKQLVIENPNANGSQMQFAIRGLARNDKDYVASILLLNILENRLHNESSIQEKTSVFVRQQPYLLSGSIIFGLSSTKAGTVTEKSITNLFNQKITVTEFEQAKIKYLDTLTENNFVSRRLDLDTFPISTSHLSNTKLEDVQKLAEKLQKQPVVSVIIRKSDEAK